jgi:DDE superfamily endonuclease
MPPERIILLPPTHESLPSFHVQGDLLPSFLDHLANSRIKVPEPPEPQKNSEPGAISVVEVDVEEGTSLKALDRLDPVLPLSPGRAERHGFEYFRHGTLSLYAALNTRTDDVPGKTTARHTSAEFVDFLGQIVASQPEGREIHIVADHLSAHKTKNVFEFLQANPTVRIHSSWLSQVEIWFFKIQRDVISRGIFSSTTDLSRKLIRYIKQYNKTATPFHWRVKNADNRIKPVTQRASDSVH